MKTMKRIGFLYLVIGMLLLCCTGCGVKPEGTWELVSATDREGNTLTVSEFNSVIFDFGKTVSANDLYQRSAQTFHCSKFTLNKDGKAVATTKNPFGTHEVECSWSEADGTLVIAHGAYDRFVFQYDKPAEILTTELTAETEWEGLTISTTLYTLRYEKKK